MQGGHHQWFFFFALYSANLGCYITLLIKISVLCGPVPWVLAFCPSDREVMAQRLRRSRTPRRKEGEAQDRRNMVGGG